MEEGAVVTWWQGVLSYLHPALLWCWVTGPHSWIYRIYRNIKSGFDPRFRRRRRLLSWMGQASGRDVTDLSSVWRDGTILCDLIHRSCPSACLGHEESQVQDTFRHAQALAYRCLLLQPAFTEDELSHPELSPHIERRLFRYLQSLRQAIAKKQLNRSAEEESDGEAHVAEEYIARGMGLIMASTSQRAIFYVYSRDGSSLMDIHIEIRGPGDDFGSILVTESESYDNPTGASIAVEYRLTEEYLRVSYQPRSVGHHELSISRHGYNVPGSPFLVSVDEISEKIPKKRFNSVEWFTEDEERRQKELQEKKKKAKVKYRIVDFVTEKMYLTEDGKLLNIPPEDVQCATPPPPDFPAPFPPPTPDALLTPPSPTSSTDSRSQCKKGRTLSPRPRRKRGERTKWMNIKQERMKYIIVKPQKAELKRVSDAAAQVTLEFQPSMFQERCKRIVTVCDYLLQHCPRQTSLEIISGAGHILQSLKSDKDRSENSVIKKPRISEPDDDDDVFVPATVPSPTTVRTITYPERCRSVSLSHVRDESNDAVQKETEHISRDSDTERRRESDSSITHLASEARKCFRCEGNTKSPGRRTSFSSIYQVSDSKSQNKSTVDEDSYDLLTVTDNRIVYGEDCLDHTANDAEIQLVNYKQFSNENCSSHRLNDITPDGVLLHQISDPSIFADACNNTTCMGESSPKSTQASDTLNVRNNVDVNRQLNEERPSKETNDNIILPKGNNVGKIIARFETNLSLEQDRESSLLENLTESCLESEKSNVKNTSEPPLFKDPVGDLQLNLCKENDNLDNDKKLQIEYLKSIGAPLSTIRSKIQLFEKGIVKETCKNTIPTPEHEEGFNCLNTSKIRHTHDQKRIAADDEAVHIFRAEPAMVVSKHYAELKEISVNTEPVIEGIIFDFQPKRSPSKISSAQVLTDQVKIQGKICESEYKLDTWDPGILQESNLSEVKVLSESTVVADNYMPLNNKNLNPITSEIEVNQDNSPGYITKENHVCLTKSRSNDEENLNIKIVKTGSKSVDSQQLTFDMTTEETPENTISSESLDLLTSTPISNDVHTTVGTSRTEDEQIKVLAITNNFQQENCVTVRDKPSNENTTNGNVNQPSDETGLQDPTFDGGTEFGKSDQQKYTITKLQLGIINESATCQVNFKDFESPKYKISLENRSSETAACIEGNTNQSSGPATIHVITENFDLNPDKPELDRNQREHVTEHLRNEDCEKKHDVTKCLDREMSNDEHISEKVNQIRKTPVMVIENRDFAKEELITVAEVFSNSDLTVPCIFASTDDTSFRKEYFSIDTIQSSVKEVTKGEVISDEINNVSQVSEFGFDNSDIAAIDLNSKKVDNVLNKICQGIIFDKTATESERIEDCQQIDIRNLTINVTNDKKEQTSDIILVKAEETPDLKSTEDRVNTQIKKEQYNIPISGFTQKLVKVFENIYDQSPINHFNGDPNKGHIPMENYVNPVSLESLKNYSKASVARTQVPNVSKETNGVEVKGLTKKLVKLFENIYDPVSTEHKTNSIGEQSEFLEKVGNITSIDKDMNSSIIQKDSTVNEHAVENPANIDSTTSSSFNGLTKRLIEVFDDISDQKNRTLTFGSVNLDDSKALSETIISLPSSFSEQESKQCSHSSTKPLTKIKADQVDCVHDDTAILISEKERTTKYTQNFTNEHGGQDLVIIETESNPEKTVTLDGDEIIELHSSDPIRNEYCGNHMQLGQLNIEKVAKKGGHSENQSANEFFHENEDSLEQPILATLTFGDPINGKSIQEKGNAELITNETISLEQTVIINLTGSDQNLVYDVDLNHKGTKETAIDNGIENKISLETHISENLNIIDQAIIETAHLEQDNTILSNKGSDQNITEDGSLKEKEKNEISLEINSSLEQRNTENVNMGNQPLPSEDYPMFEQSVIKLEQEPTKATKINNDKSLEPNVFDDIPIVEEEVDNNEPNNVQALMNESNECLDTIVSEGLTSNKQRDVESELDSTRIMVIECNICLKPTSFENNTIIEQADAKLKQSEAEKNTLESNDYFDKTVPDGVTSNECSVVESDQDETRTRTIKGERSLKTTSFDNITFIEQPDVKLEQDEIIITMTGANDHLDPIGLDVLNITEYPGVESEKYINTTLTIEDKRCLGTTVTDLHIIVQPVAESEDDETNTMTIDDERILKRTVANDFTVIAQSFVTLEQDKINKTIIETNDHLDTIRSNYPNISEPLVVKSEKGVKETSKIYDENCLNPTMSNDLTKPYHPEHKMEHDATKEMKIEIERCLNPNILGSPTIIENPVVKEENDDSISMQIENVNYNKPSKPNIITIIDNPTIKLERNEAEVMNVEKNYCSHLTAPEVHTINEQPTVESEHDETGDIKIENAVCLEPTKTKINTVVEKPTVQQDEDENKVVTFEGKYCLDITVPEGFTITGQNAVEPENNVSRGMPTENEECLELTFAENPIIVDQPSVTLELDETIVMTIESNGLANLNVLEDLTVTENSVFESDNDETRDIPIENEECLETTVAKNITIVDQPTIILEPDEIKVVSIESKDFMDQTVPEDFTVNQQLVVESENDETREMPMENKGSFGTVVTKDLTIVNRHTVSPKQDKTKVMTIESKDCLNLFIPESLDIADKAEVESENDETKDTPIENEGSLGPFATEDITTVEQHTVTLKQDETMVMTIESKDCLDPTIPESLDITDQPVVESENDATKNMPKENKTWMETTVAKNISIVDQTNITLEPDETKVVSIEGKDIMNQTVPEDFTVNQQLVVESENYEIREMPMENEGSLGPLVIEDITTVQQHTVTLKQYETMVMTIESKDCLDLTIPESLVITDQPIVESENNSSNNMPIEDKKWMETTVSKNISIVDQSTTIQEPDETEVVSMESKDFMDQTVPEDFTVNQQLVVESENDETREMPLENEGTFGPIVTKDLTIDNSHTVSLEQDKTKVMTIESKDCLDLSIPESLDIADKAVVESENDETKGTPVENEGSLGPLVTEDITTVEQHTVTLKQDETMVMTVESKDCLDPTIPEGLEITDQPVVESENVSSKKMPKENKKWMETTVAKNISIVDQTNITLEPDETKEVSIEGKDIMNQTVPEDFTINQQLVVESENYEIREIPIENEGSFGPIVTEDLIIVDRHPVTLKQGKTKVMTIESKDCLDLTIPKSLNTTEHPTVEWENYKTRGIQIDNDGCSEPNTTENIAIVNQSTVSLERNENQVMNVERKYCLNQTMHESHTIAEQPVFESGNNETRDKEIEDECSLEPTIAKDLTIADQRTDKQEEDEKVVSFESKDCLDLTLPEGFTISKELVAKPGSEETRNMSITNERCLESSDVENIKTIGELTGKQEEYENTVVTIEKNDCLIITVPEDFTIAEQLETKLENIETGKIVIENEGCLKPTVTENLTIIDQTNVILKQDETTVMTIDSNHFTDLTESEGVTITGQAVVDFHNVVTRGMSIENEGCLEPTVAENRIIVDQPPVILEQDETRVMTIDGKNILDPTVDKGPIFTEQTAVKPKNNKTKDMQNENYGSLETTVTENLTIVGHTNVTLDQYETKIITIENNDFTELAETKGITITQHAVVESENYETIDTPIEYNESLQPTFVENLTIVDEPTVILDQDETTVMTIKSNNSTNLTVPEKLNIIEQAVDVSENDLTKNLPIENKGCIEPTVSENPTIVEQPTVPLEQDETKVLPITSKGILDLTLDKCLTITEQMVVETENKNIKDMQIENDGFLESTITENLTIIDHNNDTLEQYETNISTIVNTDFTDLTVSEDITVLEKDVVESEKDETRDTHIENEGCMGLIVTKDLTIVDQCTFPLEQDKRKVIPIKSNDFMDPSEPDGLAITEKFEIESENYETRDTCIGNERCLEHTVADNLTVDEQTTVILKKDEETVLTIVNNDFMDLTESKCLTITEQAMVDSNNDETSDTSIDKEECLEPTVAEQPITFDQSINSLEQDETKVMAIESKDFTDLTVSKGRTITEQAVVDFENIDTREMPIENEGYLEPTATEKLTIDDQPTFILEQGKTTVMTIESYELTDLPISKDLTITGQSEIKSENDETRDTPIANERCLEQTVNDNFSIDEQATVILEKDKETVLTIVNNDLMDLTEPKCLTITEQVVIKTENDKNRDTPIENEEGLQLTIAENHIMVDVPPVTLEQDEPRIMTIERTNILDPTVDENLTFAEQLVVKGEHNKTKDKEIENNGPLETNVTENLTMVDHSNVTLQQYETKIINLDNNDIMDLTIPKGHTNTERAVVESEYNETRDTHIEYKECFQPTVAKNHIIVYQPTVILDTDESTVMTIDRNDFTDLVISKDLNITEQVVIESKFNETRDTLIENEECLEPTIAENHIMVDLPPITLEEEGTRVMTIERKDILDPTVDESLTFSEQAVVVSKNYETRDTSIVNEECLALTVAEKPIIVDQPVVTLDEDETKVMAVESKDFTDLTVPELRSITEQAVVDLENVHTREMPIGNDGSLETSVTGNLTIADHPNFTLQQYETNIINIEYNDFTDLSITKGLTIAEQAVVESENNETIDTHIKYKEGLQPTVGENHIILDQPTGILDQDETAIMTIRSNNFIDVVIPKDLNITEQVGIESEKDETRDTPIEHEKCLEQTVADNLTIDEQATVILEKDKETVLTIVNNDFMDLTESKYTTNTEQDVIESENDKIRNTPIENEEGLEPTFAKNHIMVDLPPITLEEEETRVMTIKRKVILDPTVADNLTIDGQTTVILERDKETVLTIVNNDLMDLTESKYPTILKQAVVDLKNVETSDTTIDNEECLALTVAESPIIVDQPINSLEQDETNVMAIESKDFTDLTVPRVRTFTEQAVVDLEKDDTPEIPIEKDGSLETTVTENLTMVDHSNFKLQQYETNIINVEYNDFTDLTIPKGLTITEQDAVESGNGETIDTHNEYKEYLQPTVAENHIIGDQPMCILVQDETTVMTIESNDFTDVLINKDLNITEKVVIESENYETRETPIEYEECLQPKVVENLTIVDKTTAILEQDETTLMAIESDDFTDVTALEDLNTFGQSVDISEHDETRVTPIQNEECLEPTVSENHIMVDQPTVTMEQMTIESKNILDLTVDKRLTVTEQILIEPENYKPNNMQIENDGCLQTIVTGNLTMIDHSNVTLQQYETKIITIENNDFTDLTVSDDLTIIEKAVVESENGETKDTPIENEGSLGPLVTENITTVTLKQDETMVMTIESKDCLDPTIPNSLDITDQPVVVSENDASKNMPIENKKWMELTVSENLTIVDRPTVTLGKGETRVMTIESKDFTDLIVPEDLTTVEEAVVNLENVDTREMPIENDECLKPTITEYLTIVDRPSVTLKQDETKLTIIENKDFIDVTSPECLSNTELALIESEQDKTLDMPIDNERCFEPIVTEHLIIVEQPSTSLEQYNTDILNMKGKDVFELTVPKCLTIAEQPVIEPENDKTKYMSIENKGCLESTVVKNLAIVGHSSVKQKDDESNAMTIKSNDSLEKTVSKYLTITEQPVVESEHDVTEAILIGNGTYQKSAIPDNLVFLELPVVKLEQNETKSMPIENKRALTHTVSEKLPITVVPAIELENDETMEMVIENKDNFEPLVHSNLDISEHPVINMYKDYNNEISIEYNDCLTPFVPKEIQIIKQSWVESEHNESQKNKLMNNYWMKSTVPKDHTLTGQPIVELEQETMETKIENSSLIDPIVNDYCTIVERPGFVLVQAESKEIIIENCVKSTVHNKPNTVGQHVVYSDQDETKTLNIQDDNFLDLNVSKGLPTFEQPISDLVNLKNDGLKLITIQNETNLEQAAIENPTVYTVDYSADIIVDLKEIKAIDMHVETAGNAKQTVTEDLTVYDEVIHFKNDKSKVITEEGESNLDQTGADYHFVNEHRFAKPFLEESSIVGSDACIYEGQEGVNVCLVENEAILNEEGNAYLGTGDENKHTFPAKELYLQLVSNINSQSDHVSISNKDSNSSQTNNSLPLHFIKSDCKGQLPQAIHDCSLDSKSENYEITSKGFENTKCNESTELIIGTQIKNVGNSFEQKISIASKIKQFIFPESDEYDLKLTDNLAPKGSVKERLTLMSYRSKEDDILVDSPSNTPEPTILSSVIVNKRQSSGVKEQSLVQQLKQRFESPFSNVETCKELKRLPVFETVDLENQEIRGLCGIANDLKQDFTVIENNKIAAINTETTKEEMSARVYNQACCEGRLVNERDIESDSLKTNWDCALDPSVSVLETSGQTTTDTFPSNKYSSLINFENEELASKHLFNNTLNEGIRQMLSLDSEMLNNNLLTVEQELCEVLSIEDEELDRSLEKEIYDIEAMETPDEKCDDHFHFQEHNRELIYCSEDVLGIENEKLDIQTQQQIMEIDQMICPAEAESSIKMFSENSTCNDKRVIRVDPSLLSFDPMDDDISSLEDEKLDEDILTEISNVESVAYNEGGVNETMISVQDYHKTISFETVNMEIVDNVNIEEEELDEETQRVLQEVEDPRDSTTGCYLSYENIETSHSAMGFFSGYSTLDGSLTPCPPESSYDSQNCETEKCKLVSTEYDVLSSYNDNDEAIIEDRMDNDEYGAGEYMVSTDGPTKSSNLLQHDMNNYEFFNPTTSKSELNFPIDPDQLDYYVENNECSAEAMLSSFQSETTGGGESFSESLQDFKDINLSLSTESDSSEFHMWSSNVEFGEPGDVSTIQEGMDFDSIISAPNLDEALKKLERHIQDKGEGFQWLSTRTPSPSLQSLETCFKDGVSFFDTEEFYSQVSGGIISGNALSSQTYRSNESEENTGKIDIWATPCENLPSCTYVQGSLEASDLESESQDEQPQDWIISPYQYPRVIFGNTTQMSIIDEEDDLRKSEPTSPLQIKCMNLNIDETHKSSEIMASTKEIASQSSLYNTGINYKSKGIHDFNAKFSIEEYDFVNENNTRDSEKICIIDEYKPEIESCLTNSTPETNFNTSNKTNDAKETDKNKITSTDDKLALETISLDHNNINLIISENIVQDNVEQSKDSLNETNLCFTKHTNTVNKERQQMYKAPKLTDAKFYAMNKDHVESKIETDLGSYLNEKDQISSANNELFCMENIQKEIIQDDTLTNVNANYPKDKRIREEVKYLLEHKIDSITEEIINEFSVSERKMYWDAKLKKLQDLESQSSSYSGPKSLSKIKSGTVSKLVSCFGQKNEDVPGLPILQKQPCIYPKTSSYKSGNKSGTDHKYKEGNIDIAEKTKSESSDQPQCVGDKTAVQSTASMKLVSHWKTYWDDMINDQTENNNSQPRTVYKIPSIQISEDDESGVTTVLYDEVSSNHNCNKDILREEILSSVPTDSSMKIEYLATKIDQECPSTLNRLNKCDGNKSGEETLRQGMTSDNTLSSEILTIPVMPRPRSYSAGNIDKEFLTIPNNKSLEVDHSCSDGNSQMLEREGSVQHQNEFKMRFERAKQFFKHLELSGPGDIKGRDYRSMPRLDSSNKTRKLSVDSDSGPEIKPQKKRDHFRSRRRRKKKEKDSCKIQSAPTSDTETSKRVQRQESCDSFGGSVKIRKVAERFLVKDLFRDVSDKGGFFKGIPNRAAVLASLRSVDDVRAVSPYEMDYEDLKPSTSLGNIPSGFQEEYPYLPTTPIQRFRPRSALGLNLIPRSELLDEKF